MKRLGASSQRHDRAGSRRTVQERAAAREALRRPRPLRRGRRGVLLRPLDRGAIVAANLRASRLTILYGPSGVGKSSLLMAGAVHGLRARRERGGRPSERPFAICSFRSWRDDPLPRSGGVGRRPARPGRRRSPAWRPATPSPRRCVRGPTGRTLLVVLDQFEEYFQYHPEEGGEGRLLRRRVARDRQRPNLRVNVLLSIREDAWAKLDRFEGHVPALVRELRPRRPLDRDAAREAIEGPVAAWNRRLPPASSRTRSSRRSSRRCSTPRRRAAWRSRGDGVAGDPSAAPATGSRRPSCSSCWSGSGGRPRRRARTSSRSRGSRRSAAPQRIVENHLLDALAGSRPPSRTTPPTASASSSASKTKIAHPASDLAEWTERPEAEVTAVLEKLCPGESGRILRAISPPPDELRRRATSSSTTSSREPILDWRRVYEQERAGEPRSGASSAIGGVLLALVAVFAGLGIWALVQRNEARTRRGPRPRSLWRRPPRTCRRRSPRVAAAGPRGVPGEPELRRRGAHARGAPGRPAFGSRRDPPRQQTRCSSVAFSPDGRTLATADFGGTLRLWDVAAREPLGRPLAAHTGAVWGSPSARTGARSPPPGDGTVRLWDHEHRKPLGR